jgi:hypothetical protein
VVASAQPQPAAAYPCAEAPTTVRTPQLAEVSPDECSVPESLRRSPTPERAKKKEGSIGTLAVFVLAIAGALLIPIGRKGLAPGADPYGPDRSSFDVLPRKSSIR